MERKSELDALSVHFPGLGEGARFYGARSAPPRALPPREAETRRSRLASVIADEILPRLQRFHHEIAKAGAPPDAPSSEEIVEFGALTIGPDIGAASLYFDKMRAKGHSLDTLFVHFLAPTARHLGELWEQDLCDFIDVTIGVGRLQELLSIFGAADQGVTELHHRALLIATPGERHLFGLDMVASFMRNAGWTVSLGAGLGVEESAAVAAREWYGVAGVTLSAPSGLEAAAAAINAIRRSSVNRAISVIAGGPVFSQRPELALQAGADAAAIDAPTAVLLAKKLLLAQAGVR